MIGADARRLAAAGVIALAALAATGAAAQPIETNLAAGPAGATSARIGTDLAALVAECGRSLGVLETAGGVETFQAMRERRATQVGIVNADVLEFYRTFAAEDAAVGEAARGITVVLPLFDEELHLVAARSIAGIGELEGARVAIGDPLDGGNLTSRLALDLAETAPAELVEVGGAEALSLLEAGEVDAVMLVGGTPIPLLAEAGLDPARFHLAPVDTPALRAAYGTAEIPGGFYGFAPEPTPTVPVQAVLIAFDFQPERNAYQAGSCAFIADLTNLTLSRLDRLREIGHSKWGAARFDALPEGWPVSDCARAGAAPGYALVCPGDPPAEAAAAPPQTVDEIFRSHVCARVGC